GLRKREGASSSATAEALPLRISFIRRSRTALSRSTRRLQPRHRRPISAPRRTTSHSSAPQGWALRRRTISPIWKSTMPLPLEPGDHAAAVAIDFIAQALRGGTGAEGKVVIARCVEDAARSTDDYPCTLFVDAGSDGVGEAALLGADAGD